MGQCTNIWDTIWLSSRRPLAVPRRSPPTAPILPWHATESGSTWYGPWFDNQKLFPPFEPLSSADGANMCSLATKLAAAPRRELGEGAMAVGSRRRLPGNVGTTRGLRPDRSAASQSGLASCRRAPRRWTAPTILAVSDGLLDWAAFGPLVCFAAACAQPAALRTCSGTYSPRAILFAACPRSKKIMTDCASNCRLSSAHRGSPAGCHRPACDTDDSEEGARAFGGVRTFLPFYFESQILLPMELSGEREH